jgi:polyisoprenyl-teichoic acid--peptidoglycan teichoic acid transferase
MQIPSTAKPKKIKMRWIIIILLGIVLGVGGTIGYKMLRQSNTSLGQLVSRPFNGQGFVRILVLGEDNTSKMRRNGRGLSDTIMVIAVDLDAKTVRAISVPRDSRVEIAGHGFQKINSANVFGGPEFARQTVQAVLGVPIDYYIKTNIPGLKNTVDMVGGVGIDVEKDMHYTDRRGGLYINLKKGFRHLDGDKALQYVRFRHDKLGDITRMERQQKFLRALSRQIVSPSNWVRLPQVVDELYSKGYIETNMSGKDMVALARLARDVPQEKIQTETVPGLSQRIDGGSYYIIDPTQTAEAVQRLLEPVPANKARVEVLNGAGVEGLAKVVASELQKSGYIVVSTGNAPGFSYDKTQIVVHNDSTNEVEVTRLVHCTQVKYDHNKSATADMTVIIGKDYKQ